MKEKKKEEKYLDIAPITKGRRMLVFLGDFFINFIVAMFIFNIIAFPIGQVSSGYDEKMALIDNAEKDRNQVLYDNKLLYYELDEEKNSLQLNLNYTFDLYLRYYVFENDEDVQYEVIKKYYVEIVKDESLYLNLYRDVNKSYNFFDITNNDIHLKQEYKDSLKLYFDEDDVLGEEDLHNYDTFLNNVFLFLYSEMLLNIEQNNTIPEYNNYQTVVKEVNNYYDILIVTCSYVSFLISSIIFYLVIPMINKSGKTITMQIMKIERVAINNLYFLKRKERILQFVFELVFNLAFIMFLPSFVVSFNYLFSAGTLFIVSLISLILIIASFVSILLTAYNRSLIDFISQTVLISSDDFDEMARIKGYLHDWKQRQ